MCSKHLRSPVKGDWVVAYRLHHGQPVQVPSDRDERRWLAEYLVDVYGCRCIGLLRFSVCGLWIWRWRRDFFSLLFF